MSNLFEKTMAALWKKLGLPSPDDDWRRLRSQRRALDKQAIQQHMEWQDYRESYESIEDGREAQRHEYQTLWLKEIKRRLMSLREGTSDDGAAAPVSSTVQPVVFDETHKLMKLLLATLKGFADEFNELTAQTPMFAQMHFVSTEVSEVKEPCRGLTLREQKQLRRRHEKKLDPSAPSSKAQAPGGRRDPSPQVGHLLRAFRLRFSAFLNNTVRLLFTHLD